MRSRDADLPLFNQLDRENFRSPFLTRTTVTNCLPPSLKFEIECVAAVPTSSS
jgi:2-iminobutanoate/2-iminopropanoate deaminase